MPLYILKRLLYGLLTIWFIATATFFTMHAVPGNPLNDEKATSEEIRKNLEKKYGLDKPLSQQYLIYLGNMMKGDFGISFTQKNRSVNDIIREHFPVSALLGVIALVYSALGAIVLGAFSAHYKNRWPDYVLVIFVVITISVPSFVFAALSQLLVLKLNQYLGIKVFPIAGWGSVWHLILPALILGLGSLAYLTRLMRSSLLEIEQAHFIRTAKAKGLSEQDIFLKHKLRNAILPLVTVLGPNIAAITTGGFVVESIFAIPGLGKYFVEAVHQLDYTLIMGTTVFYGTYLVVMVLLVDILYGYIDPRIRLSA